MEKVTIGRIVEFFPSKNDENGLKLPNGMESAPATVVQIFGNYVNLNVHTADPNGNPTKQAWSVMHKSEANGSDVPHWDWFARV